jgi:hypothetical protein
MAAPASARKTIASVTTWAKRSSRLKPPRVSTIATNRASTTAAMTMGMIQGWRTDPRVSFGIGHLLVFVRG